MLVRQRGSVLEERPGLGLQRLGMEDRLLGSQCRLKETGPPRSQQGSLCLYCGTGDWFKFCIAVDWERQSHLRKLTWAGAQRRHVSTLPSVTSCHPLPSSACQFSFLCPCGSIHPRPFCWSTSHCPCADQINRKKATPSEPDTSKYTSAGSLPKEEYLVNRRVLRTFPHLINTIIITTIHQLWITLCKSSTVCV